MATRIATFETHIGVSGKVGHTLRDIRCGDCGGEVPSRFMNVCPNCGADFDFVEHRYAEDGEERK